MNETEVISRIFLFRDMKDEEISSYIEQCERRTFHSGETVHSAKEPINGIGVLLSGKCRIVSGNGDALLRVLRDGDFFGAASVFIMENSNRTSVVAAVKTNILIIPTEVIMKIIYSYPDASVRYITFLSNRINFLNTRISSLTAGDAASRVAGYILSLGDNKSDNAVIEGSLTDVAQHLNIGRASLYRTIDRFIDEGYIVRNKNSITILDRNSLEDIIYKNDSGDFRQRKD